jgi:hypothetical protein
MSHQRHSAFALAVSLAFTALAHADYISPNREITPAPAYDAADPVAEKIKYDPNYVPPKVGVGHVTINRRDIAPPIISPTGQIDYPAVDFDVFVDVVGKKSNGGTAHYAMYSLQKACRLSYTPIPNHPGLYDTTFSFDPFTLTAIDPPQPTDPDPITSALLRQGSPSAPNGQTQVTDLGNGQFQFTSFFDVFFDISLDNGTTWTPAELPHHLTALPEPASIALVLPTLFVLRRSR